MTESARVRISKITPKNGGAIVSILPTRPDPDDSNFVSTLIWAIEQARLGKVIGYAMVFGVEYEAKDGEPRRRFIEAAKAWDEVDDHYVLGLIRRLEMNYSARTWPEDEA